MFYTYANSPYLQKFQCFVSFLENWMKFLVEIRCFYGELPIIYWDWGSQFHGSGARTLKIDSKQNNNQLNLLPVSQQVVCKKPYVCCHSLGLWKRSPNIVEPVNTINYFRRWRWSKAKKTEKKVRINIYSRFLFSPARN
jgi:hypothetical protein